MIENSLVIRLSVNDQTHGKDLTRGSLELIATLRNLDSGLNLKLHETRAVLKQLAKYDNLHRPDQGQKDTSGPLVKLDDVEQAIKCAKEVYELARQKSMAIER